ncbi:hypothetical protein ACFQ9X_33660 [Catenulispora yoronensis]
MEEILAELAAVEERVVLIIDDAHMLRSPEAAEQLTSLLTRLPPGARAILAARRDPPLRLHRLRLAGELIDIRAEDLRFTLDETRELLATAGVRLSETSVRLLVERTEGWAAGCAWPRSRSSITPIPNGSSPSSTAATGPSRSI